jgi:xanthine dehydrogenase accessory factor
MVVFDDGTALGKIEGTIGGGAVEHEVRKRAITAIAALKPEQFKVALTHELGMCCGGQMTIFVEPLRERPPCIIFGAGHIALALGQLASQSGFSLHICDPRQELLTQERLSFAWTLLAGYQSSDLDKMPFGPDAFVVIVTHCHQTDQALTEEILPRTYRYLALVGSARKAALTRQRCLNKGHSAELIERLHCPAGINIGAETPEEIAVSILAQMIKARRNV